MASSLNRQEHFPLQSHRMLNHSDTVVDIDNPEPPPKDYLLWSLCTFVYLNPLCLATPALYCSIQARDKRLQGDTEGAKACACKACWMNGVLVSIFAILLIICIIFAILTHELLDIYGIYRYPFKHFSGLVDRFSNAL